MKEIEKVMELGKWCKDGDGGLIVGGGVGVSGDRMSGVRKLVEGNVDVVVIDRGHGD
uniref:IMP dehydrogenase n=1 Tax=Bacillus pumilus TaxID=1408 RepID=UPI0011AB0B69